MTLLHYTLADAQQWAAFSGDENPIHFDLAAARQMGAGQLSVHGMRALLDVKRDAHSRLYRPERYVKCQAEPESLVGKRPCTIAPKTLRELQSCFNAAWPDLAQWQFLDALLFRQLIGDPALLRQENIASLLGPGETSLQQIFTRYPVLQTHQEVVFDARLAGKATPIRPESLALWLLPSLVVGQAEQGALVRIAAAAQLDDLIITNVVTLKVGPVHN